MEQAGSERRRYERIPTDLDAVAALPQGVLGDCSILDMNIYGARLETLEELPEEFFLVDLASNVAYRARVAWRRAPLLGTRFLETWLLSGDGAPEWLSALRAERMTAAAAARAAKMPPRPGRRPAAG
jgi:hypothetical protein